MNTHQNGVIALHFKLQHALQAYITSTDYATSPVTASSCTPRLSCRRWRHRTVSFDLTLTLFSSLTVKQLLPQNNQSSVNLINSSPLLASHYALHASNTQKTCKTNTVD